MNRILVEPQDASFVEYEDGRTHDKDAVRRITQEWVEFHMSERDKEFTKPTTCSVFCGTWNVNAKKQEGGLEEWILPSDAPMADIYAVGFQEIVDLNAMNVAINSSATREKALFWRDKITEGLDSRPGNYTLLGEKFLVGLLLCVFVREELMPHVLDVRTASAGVGLMGMMGNKGGVSVRFSLYDSSLCFVCSHLAAHRENIAGRNADFKNIIDRSLFSVELGPGSLKGAAAGTGSGRESSTVNGFAPSGGAGAGGAAMASLAESVTLPPCHAVRTLTQELHILEHEVVIWMGDLNYRIDDAFSTDQVFKKIAADRLDELRDKDQLNIERARGNVFQGFEEGRLDFPPTYKYQPGTDMYDRRPDKKVRAPAWCDRVLWRAEDTLVRQINYRRAPLNPSDHKPVSSLLECELRTIVESNQRIVFGQLLSVLRAHGVVSEPKVEIQGLSIVLEKVHYEAAQVRPVRIRNTGESIVHWHLVPKLDEVQVSKSWVSVDKESGLLLPGEEVTIALTVKVDRRTAQALNAGKDSLEDLVVLRIERSIDYHIAVSAKYARSSFGMSLQELVLTPQPVATTLLPVDRYNLPPPQAVGAVAQMDIPKELWRLVDALWSGGALQEKDLFNSKGDAAEVAAIRGSLDSGEPLPSCSAHSVCEALVAFLAALPQPLLPADAYPSSEIPPELMRAFCRKFLDDLPPLNFNAFVCVLSFLREVLVEANFNRCTPLLLANSCVSCMLYPEELHLSKEEQQRRIAKQTYMQSVLIHLLTAAGM
ncbi:Endonuclease/exonuclease/phosphatase [Ochromonadaceae sp. CCMP2298]|nr:Endonuclease/exonuclease/phosphatase [Ochromonadaceae sp. CCMP2298]|mmetsp:Transcript_4470/g.10083  ORF Transcript_4470/g.10083 Transcript_4470/m.10083 type:complete len:767 (+) Transcript_4470:64-2364(+)